MTDVLLQMLPHVTQTYSNKHVCSSVASAEDALAANCTTHKTSDAAGHGERRVHHTSAAAGWAWLRAPHAAHAIAQGY